MNKVYILKLSMQYTQQLANCLYVNIRQTIDAQLGELKQQMPISIYGLAFHFPKYVLIWWFHLSPFHILQMQSHGQQ